MWKVKSRLSLETLVLTNPNRVSFISREGYSHFLREMIIQPGIAKANLGLFREDVTMEDHVSEKRRDAVVSCTNPNPVVPCVHQAVGRRKQKHWKSFRRI